MERYVSIAPFRRQAGDVVEAKVGTGQVFSRTEAATARAPRRARPTLNPVAREKSTASVHVLSSRNGLSGGSSSRVTRHTILMPPRTISAAHTAEPKLMSCHR